MSGRENPYERKFDQGYARRDNAGGYTFRHAGPGSEPHSSDSNRSSKSGKSNQSTKSAKEKRDARILANDFTQSPEDSFEDAHDRTFLELPQAESEVLHDPIGQTANSEPAAGLVHPTGASPVFFPAITPDHGASSPALSSSEASPDMGDPVQPQQGSMAGPKPRQGQMSPSQTKGTVGTPKTRPATPTSSAKKAVSPVKFRISSVATSTGEVEGSVTEVNLTSAGGPSSPKPKTPGSEPMLTRASRIEASKADRKSKSASPKVAKPTSDLPATPPMFEPSDLGAGKTPSPTDDVFDATVLPNKVTERPDSRKGFRFPSPKQYPGSHIGASDYTPRRYLTKTPPEKIDNPQVLRQRIYELQNQLLAGQNIVESTENVLSQTVASHKQERKRLTDELERANAVIDDLTQEIERLEAQLQVTEEPRRHEQAEVTRLQDMLEQSRAEVATLRQDLEQRLQALGYSEAGSAELHKMFDRVDEYREENHHLKQGIIGLEGEIDELNSELDFLRTAYANLRENQNDPEGIALDLRLCQAQLGQQILALTTHLQNETARFEQARVENLAVIEAQRARITQLESEKTQLQIDQDSLLKYQQELYDYIPRT
ncbi:uncharacterized protein LOC129595023 [Paramacrobiotus metropolitanus]|uniref:uncharacterized protein LOC129595023 n=1 Tax=Paramacrobiotus metropolitanus TaxID=2943436 RepID=UPI00244649D3|nr:uncharacterized protein LOC129595023 [Paramacrobiotus metropolitanus]